MGYSEYLLYILDSGQVPEKPGYTVYTRQKILVQADTLPEDAVLVTAQYFEALLYQSCMKHLDTFARSEEK